MSQQTRPTPQHERGRSGKHHFFVETGIPGFDYIGAFPRFGVEYNGIFAVDV